MMVDEYAMADTETRMEATAFNLTSGDAKRAYVCKTDEGMLSANISAAFVNVASN